MKTIEEKQNLCFEAMEGDWENMTDEELLVRFNQWADNLQLQ